MALTKILNDENKSFQPVLTDKLVYDTKPTVNSFNGITSDAVARAIAGASGEVPAVTESDNGKVLTAVYDEGGAAVEWADAQGGGAEYSAGTGISISAQDEISVDTTVIATKNDLSGYQPTISDLDTIRSGASAGATAVQPGSLATVATSGSYADLSNKPSIPAAQVNSDWNAASGVSQILNKPSLATVATSGSYADLSNKPTIPTVDQTYNSASTNAQSGTAVAGALATVNQVPASTSADEDKVLTVNGSGTPVWAAAQGGGADVTVDTTNNNIEFGSDVVLHYTVTDGGSMTWTGSRNEFGGTSFEWRWDNSEPAPSATLTLTIPNNISKSGNAITSVVFKDVSNSTCTVSGGTLLSNGVIQAGTYTVTASSAATTVLIKAIVTFTNSLAPMDATYIDAGFAATTLGISGGTPTADLMPNVPRTSADNGKVLTVTDTSGTLGWSAIPTELPTVTGNAGKVLTVNSGATGVEWAAPVLGSVTSIQQVNALPANPDANTLYLIPEA